MLASEERKHSLKSSLAEKTEKNITRFLIEGEWLAVNVATGDSRDYLSAIGKRIVNRLKSRKLELSLSTLEGPVKRFLACRSHVACDDVLKIKHMPLRLDEG